MKTFTRRFLSSVSGVSAIEFAIILPVMVTMFLGMAEVSNYIEMSRRTASLASTAADLVAQEASVDTADINDVFATMAIVGSPMPAGSIRIAITSVVADPDGVTNRVAWSDARNRTPRVVGSVVSSAEFPSGMLLAFQGAIMVEVEYPFTPMFTGIIPSSTLRSVFYLKPRRSLTVLRTT
ncbi:MAG: pilus assembly protein [Alphaproteobacteria bacterium]|nr:pilus assembly protein [Alphaproteobacteria bacterium]